MQDNTEALDVLMEAIDKSGHAGKVKIGASPDDSNSIERSMSIQYLRNWARI